MISLRNVTVFRGVKPILKDASLVLHAGDRVGLVGPNGCGKSTLFDLLRGEHHADAGDVDIPSQWTIAHVSQETPASQRSAVEYAIDGDRALRALEAELEEANHANDGHRIGDLHALLADRDAYTALPRAESMLLGLGFSAGELSMPVSSFSGGWRMRLNLAQALMCRSDLLLLDEPTNHLDLDAILWLERWLDTYPGTLVVVSHDRDFLDGVAKAIVRIERLALTRYNGNYSAAELQRAAQIALTQSAWEKQQREIAHLHSFIDRFKAKATKAKQAQSRVKALARMELVAPVHAASPFSFEFREPAASPNPMFTISHGTAGYPGRTVLRDLDFSLQTAERIGLLGANGAGKSTFVKTLAGTLPLLSGDLHAGKGLAIGYFAQHQIETLRGDESPLRQLGRIAPTTREQELRDFLGSFNFNGDMAMAPVESFSGGERARLALALIIWKRPNLLLLDEPTNHLDLDTREALTFALSQFDGSMILVSHDRHLLRATADVFWIVADGTVRVFDGDLDDYAKWMFDRKSAPPAGAAVAPVAQASEPPPASRKVDRRAEAEERQRASRLRKPFEERLRRIEKMIDRHSGEKARLDALLADAALYDDARKDELRQAMMDHAYACKEIDRLEAEWLEQQERLETATP